LHIVVLFFSRKLRNGAKPAKKSSDLAEQRTESKECDASPKDSVWPATKPNTRPTERRSGG